MLSEIKWRFAFAIFSSLFLILWTAFQWSIIDRVTGFIYGPIAGLATIVYFVAAAAALTCLIKIKKIGVIAFLPLVVVITTFLIMEFVPFTNLWLKADFTYYQNEREEIVQKVLSNELTSNVSHNSRFIKLNDSYPYVSMGGNEIVVEEHNGLKYVFFYTFRGILDNYSGFVFVPGAGRPENYADLSESGSTQISHWGGNWYYASHR